MSTRGLGVQGEAVAARYYQKLGFRLFAHHYATRLGELDLVLTCRDLVVIAEVKTRTNPAAAAPREAVDGGTAVFDGTSRFCTAADSV